MSQHRYDILFDDGSAWSCWAGNADKAAAKAIAAEHTLPIVHIVRTYPPEASTKRKHGPIGKIVLERLLDL